MTTAWSGSPCPSVSYERYGFPTDYCRFTAWDDVSSRRDEKKKFKDNGFRADHPHLAEWKEVSPALVAQPNSANDAS